MPRAILLFLAILAPELALAHHAGAEYDLSKTVEFKAKLTRGGIDQSAFVDLLRRHGKRREGQPPAS